MPALQTKHTRRFYYDFFPANLTTGDSLAHAPVLLLVHGFASTPTSDFAAQLPAFQTRYQVLAPHLSGYGRSSPRETYSLDYYRESVADLLALLDHLAVHQVLVVGFSDGAIVSLLLAALHPDRVQALAVLGAQATLCQEDVACIRHWFLDTPLSAAGQAQQAALHGAPYWRSLPALYVQVQDALVAAGGVLISDEELASISAPTLLMHGIRDRVVPVAYAYVLAQKIAGARLHLFETGHPAHLRYPAEFTQLVMDFLS